MSTDWVPGPGTETNSVCQMFVQLTPPSVETSTSSVWLPGSGSLMSLFHCRTGFGTLERSTEGVLRATSSPTGPSQPLSRMAKPPPPPVLFEMSQGSVPSGNLHCPPPLKMVCDQPGGIVPVEKDSNSTPGGYE